MANEKQDDPGEEDWFVAALLNNQLHEPQANTEALRKVVGTEPEDVLTRSGKALRGFLRAK